MTVTPTPAASPVALVTDRRGLMQTLVDLIDAAEDSLVFQMYLLAGNDELALLLPREGAFPGAALLADRLIAKRRARPELPMAVLLDTQTPDDASVTRRGHGPLTRHRLEAAGVPVLNANLFGTAFDARRRWPPAARFHALPAEATPPERWVARQQAWQTWHNVEDHRKNLVIDRGAWAAVTSHNCFDAAHDWHDNLFLLGGPAAAAVWRQTQEALGRALALPQRLTPAQRATLEALAAAPARDGARPLPEARLEALAPLGPVVPRPTPILAPVETFTGVTVAPALHHAIDAAEPGSRVDVATTYFSHLPTLRRLVDAARRGVQVRVLIDDCWALPLPPFEAWFVRHLVNLRCVREAAGAQVPGFALRLFPSQAGAMMHLKSAAFVGARRRVFGGQANYTPNTFEGAWLDTALCVEGEAVAAAFAEQFEPLWEAARPVPRPTVGQRWRWAGLGLALRLAEALGFRP